MSTSIPCSPLWSPLVGALLFATAATAQTPDPGDPNDFGRLVAAHGSQLAIARDTSVRMVDSVSGLQTDDILAGTQWQGLPVVDIALGPDSFGAVVQDGDDQTAVFWKRVGGVWSSPTEVGTGFSSFPPEMRIDIHGDRAIVASSSGSLLLYLTHRVFDTAAQQVIASENTIIPGAVVEVACGEDASGGLVWLTTMQGTGVARDVYRGTWNGSTVSSSLLASGLFTDDYGAALAIDPTGAWIGAPGFDGVVPEGGRLEWWGDDGAGSLAFEFAYNSNQPGDHLGRAVDMLDGVTAFSDAEADLGPSGNTAGAVRLLRQNAPNAVPEWTNTLEIYHALGNDPSQPSDHGASLALRDFSTSATAVGSVVMGAPGTGIGGEVSTRPVYQTPIIQNGLGTGLAGTGGVTPAAAAIGSTFDGAPCRVRLVNALANSTAYLVLGLAEVNLPFKGGVLFPEPLIVTGLPTDGAGSLTLDFPWEAQPGPAYSVAIQFWVQDPGAAVGFSASAGVRVTEN